MKASLPTQVTRKPQQMGMLRLPA